MHACPHNVNTEPSKKTKITLHTPCCILHPSLLEFAQQKARARTRVLERNRQAANITVLWA